MFFIILLCHNPEKQHQKVSCLKLLFLLSSDQISDSPDKANTSINPFSHTVHLPIGKGKSLCCDMNSRTLRK